MTRRRRRDTLGNDNWPADMLASYRALNPEQATWFDGEGASAQTELLARLQPGGYLELTFGPSGQNRSACDFLYLLRTSGNIVSRFFQKGGATLRWQVDGTTYTQNNLPSHTLGAGAGIITVSSLDGWAGVLNVQITDNALSGTLPSFRFPSASVLFLGRNQFSGNFPNLSLPNVQEFAIDNNQFSGNFPNLSLPNVRVFQIGANQFSGNFPNLSLPNATTVYIYHNPFMTGIESGPLGFITGNSNLKLLRCEFNALPRADIDRLLAAYHTHRAYYAGLAGDLDMAIQGGGNAPPSATGLTHRSEIISAFTSAGKTATITTS
jgi:hypothetical protein